MAMDSETQDLLRTSLRHVLTEVSDAPLADRLGELGWAEVVDDDPDVARRILFEIKGETLAGDDALGPLLRDALVAVTGSSDIGRARVTLSESLHPDDDGCVIDAGRLRGSVVVLSSDDAATPLVVTVAADEGVRFAVVDAAATDDPQALEGFDEAMVLYQVNFDAAPADVTWIDGPTADRAWRSAVALGRWALACELVGIGRVVVADAVTYTGERRQYGKPIGSFQALQQRLAAAYAGVVGAGDLVAEDAIAADPWAAMVAKAVAGRAAELACTQAQQAYGAIGFTWEHEFHRHLRRVYQLDRLLGDHRRLEFEIGTRLQATRHVPRIGVL